MKRTCPSTKYDGTVNVLHKCARLVKALPEDTECTLPQLQSLIQQWEDKALRTMQDPAVFKERMDPRLLEALWTVRPSTRPTVVVTNVMVARLWPKEEGQAPCLHFVIHFGRPSDERPNDIQWCASSLFSEMSCRQEYPLPNEDQDPVAAYRHLLREKQKRDREFYSDEDDVRNAVEDLVLWLVKKKKLSVYSRNDALYHLFY
jgi:hypothetical protein